MPPRNDAQVLIPETYGEPLHGNRDSVDEINVRIREMGKLS